MAIKTWETKSTKTTAVDSLKQRGGQYQPEIPGRYFKHLQKETSFESQSRDSTYYLNSWRSFKSGNLPGLCF